MDYINPMLDNEAGQLPGVPPGKEFVSVQHGARRDSVILSQSLQPAPGQPDAQNGMTFSLKFDAAAVEVKLEAAKGGCQAKFQDVHELINIFFAVQR